MTLACPLLECGTDVLNQDYVYGVAGTVAATNIPRERQAPATWIDNSGNFRLFVGEGFDASFGVGDSLLSDLLRYLPYA